MSFRWKGRASPMTSMRDSIRAGLLFLTGFLCCGCVAQRGPEYDVVIRGAQIVDGTGGPSFQGDVAVRGGVIAAIGAVPGQGVTEIDAAGKVVAPGFIDVHTHAENAPELPQAENFLRMGVTTVIAGNCGSSVVDVAAFFDAVTRAQTAINVGTLIGQGSLRNQVMGGSFMRPPTPAELEQMKARVAKAMEDGALGLSTGLIYLPGTYTKTSEIIALARVAAAHGGIYASHMRHEDARIFEALDEVAAIAREARIRAHVSHLKLSGGPSDWGRAEDVLVWLERARASGLELTQDQYLYTASSTGLATLVPVEAREGGTNEFIARLRDPAKKARIVEDMKTSLRRSGWEDYAYAVVASCKHDPGLNGKTVPQAARLARGAGDLDAQIEFLLDLVARGGALGVFHGMAEADLRKFLVEPRTLIASDAWIHKWGDGFPHPRGYGNNARALGRYVRELKLLTLEDAVRRMTSLPARTFRLRQRGELKPGFVADLVVFDPAQVDDPASFDDPHRYALGFSEVWVNGVPVIRQGQLTGQRPGRVVRLTD